MKKNNEKRGAVYIVWLLLALIVLGIVLISASIKSKKKNTVEEPPPKEEAVAVKTIEMKPRNVESKVLLPGRIVPFDVIELKTEKPGRIAELNVEEGDEVKKGQLLMKLDDSAWVVFMDQALIEKREAEKDVKRWKELKKTGAVSEKEHDGIIARRDLADVSYRRAMVEVEKCKIKSPIDGIVDHRTFDLGEYAFEGAFSFRLVNLDKVKVVISVPERDINSVAVGDKMSFTLSSVPGKAYTGKIRFISSIADPQSNSFKIELLADNPDNILKGGMIAEVELMRGLEENVLILSLATIIPRKGEHIVFLVDGDRVVRQTVKIGSFVGSEVVISGGLTDGDEVVVEGHRSLQDGGLIEIME